MKNSKAEHFFYLLFPVLILTFSASCEVLEDILEVAQCEQCEFANDGECDDGRQGAVTNLCSFGTDCADCGGIGQSGDPGVAFDLLPAGNNGGAFSSFRIRNRWQKDHLTYFVATVSNDLPANEQSAIMGEALDRWAGVSSLKFSPVRSADLADIVIGMGTGDHCGLYSGTNQSCGNGGFDGPNGVLAHCYFPQSGRIGGDAHFDDDEFYANHSSSGGAGVSLPAVALHEFGHGLGLEHSADTRAVMFASYNNNDVKSSLQQDDIAGIQELYGAPGGLPPSVPEPPSENPVIGGCSNPTAEDIDGDGISNAYEIYILGTNPNDCDTDDDGLSDAEALSGLNPLNPDTDGDGASDGQEIRNGSNPFVPDQGTGANISPGNFRGQDNVGGEISFTLFFDGSVRGQLRFFYAGQLYTIPLIGGFDVQGTFTLVSYDQYWIYYGNFSANGVMGNWQTRGGAAGSWSVIRNGLDEDGPQSNKNIRATALDYSPVPANRKPLIHDIHDTVSWPK